MEDWTPISALELLPPGHKARAQGQPPLDLLRPGSWVGWEKPAAAVAGPFPCCSGSQPGGLASDTPNTRHLH